MSEPAETKRNFTQAHTPVPDSDSTILPPHPSAHDMHQTIGHVVNHGSATGVVVGVNTGIINQYINFPDDEASAQVNGTQPLQLPFINVPDVAPIPAPSCISWPSNPHCIGRMDEYRTIAQQLNWNTAIAIVGIGGIGKTTLAIEMVHRYGQFFAGGVFWLNCTRPETLPTQIAQCGGSDGLQLFSSDDNLSTDEQVKRVLSCWKQATPRLLVFDDCDDPTVLRQWRPISGGCHVLITSRFAAWSRSERVQMIVLDVLKREESRTLLRDLAPHLSHEHADLIATELGDLPLALHLAGSFLSSYPHFLPATYIDHLRAPHLLEHASLIGRGSSWLPTGHDQHVARTFALSYKRLHAEHPIDARALQLLARAACFAPYEPIPQDLLLGTLPAETDKLDAYDALRRLTEVGLLEQIQDTIRMHQLVQHFVREINADPDADPMVEEVILLLTYENNHGHRPLLPASLLGHLSYVTNHALQRNAPQAATLASNVGSYFRMIGEYHTAKSFLEAALTLREHESGSITIETGISLNNLALLYQTTGQHAAAQPLLERARMIFTTILGADDPESARILNNLADVHKHMGAYGEAQRLYEQALAIQKTILGVKHQDTAGTLNNLASLLQDRGEYTRAHALYIEALAIYEEMMGAEHPQTATILNNLADVLATLGHNDEARRVCERALAIRQATLGPNHPYTAQSLSNLGHLCFNTGLLDKARSFYEQAQIIWETRFGITHPQSLQNLYRLAEVLLMMDAYQSAFQRCVAAYQHQINDSSESNPEPLLIILLMAAANSMLLEMVISESI